jgi:outer membrane protein OmpA-like peptidoglycan-associated protein
MEHQLDAQVRTPYSSEIHSSIEDTESPNRVPLHSVLQLHQRIGNRAMQRLLARQGRTVQAKLTVGAAHDHYEQEAERVAHQVMSAPVPPTGVIDQASVQRESPEKSEAAHTKPLAETITPLIQRALYKPLPVRTALLQRKCACGGTPGADGLCEECRKTGRVDPADDFEARLSTVGEGSPLPAGTRAFMEPRFGADFGGIRLHTGSEAVQLNRALGAQAFTHGQDIYLGEGNDNFEGIAGKQLLAHELTHSVQQGAAEIRESSPHDTRVPEIVQRERKTGYVQRAGDFDIRGVNPQTASQPSIIFFDMGSATIPTSEAAKISALANPAAQTLTLNGFTSEEGSAAANLTIINARIAAVRTALQAAGHTGPILANPRPTAGLGQLDYRRVRAVEIVPAGATATTPQCQPTPANPNPENEPCGTSFSTAQPLAIAKVGDAVKALTAPTSATTAILNTFFPGVPQATITSRLNSLLTQLGVMATAGGHLCHNTCDGACSRPGFMGGQGATAVMTLCPKFIHTFTLDERVTMLMHEGMHATSGPKVVDTAYRRQRLIGFLSGGQAETNTDSYVNLILSLQPGVAGPIAGGPPTDPIAPGMSGPEESACRRALAFLEKWVEIAQWDTSQLYEAIKRNIGRVGGWDPADGYHAATQHVIGWILMLTDPGAAPPYATPPTAADKIKVAGIHDRYQEMSRAVRSTPISINKGASDAWAPNLGPSFTVSTSFFGLAAMDQVLHLLRLMATSMPDIPAPLRAKYADAANQIRWHKTGIGP